MNGIIIAPGRSARQSSWVDFDNDGDLDLFAANRAGPNALFRQDAARFVRVGTEQAGDDARPTVGACWLDYDRDGALDLSVTRGYTDTGGHFLFHNDLGKPAARRSITVRVLDKAGRFTRIGAEVRLYDDAGTIVATRQVSTGEGYNSQGTQPLHFGFASMAPVTVEVTFMDKAGRKTQRLERVRPERYAGKDLVIRQR